MLILREEEIRWRDTKACWVSCSIAATVSWHFSAEASVVASEDLSLAKDP